MSRKQQFLPKEERPKNINQVFQACKYLKAQNTILEMTGTLSNDPITIVLHDSIDTVIDYIARLEISKKR